MEGVAVGWSGSLWVGGEGMGRIGTISLAHAGKNNNYSAVCFAELFC